MWGVNIAHKIGKVVGFYPASIDLHLLKRDFIIEKQIALHFVQYSNCL